MDIRGTTTRDRELATLAQVRHASPALPSAAPSVPNVKSLNELEAETTELNKLLAGQLFEIDVIKDVLQEKSVIAAAWCALVRDLVANGLITGGGRGGTHERPRAYRQEPRPDRSGGLRAERRF